MEETHTAETSSKLNLYEAELCVGLCRYLLQQDYPADTLTILTAYSGQVASLRDLMAANKNNFYDGKRFCHEGRRRKQPLTVYLTV